MIHLVQHKYLPARFGKHCCRAWAGRIIPKFGGHATVGRQSFGCIRKKYPQRLAIFTVGTDGSVGRFANCYGTLVSTCRSIYFNPFGA